MNKIPIILVFNIFLLSNANLESNSSSPVFRFLPEETLSYSTIQQNVILNDCKIKGESAVLYLCKNLSYVMTGTYTNNKFSIPSIQIESAKDGDIHDKTAAVIQAALLRLIILEEVPRTITIDLPNETPFLIRVRTRQEHIFLIVLSIFGNANEKNEGIIDTQMPGKFVLHSYIVGPAYTFHHLEIPIENLHYQVSQQSFIDGVFLDDYFERKEYFILAMKPNWIYVFRSMFQDSEMELVNMTNLEKDYHILDLASNSEFLFILYHNPITKHLKVNIYKLRTYPQFELGFQSSLDLNKKIKGNHNIELRVKKLLNTFLLLVNFPTDEILAFYFQPNPHINLGQISMEKGISLKYSDHNIEKLFGYSFEFVHHVYTGTGFVHGILLSPFPKDITSSIFVPYCFPNTFWKENSGCLPCISGFSAGGPYAQCKPCELNENQTLVQPYSPLREVCHSQCSNYNLFGPECLECREYMRSINATLPKDAEWGLDSEMNCGFTCKKGYEDYSLGTCLQETDKKIVDDPCIQIKDCINCSFSQSCGWCNGTCQNLKKCPLEKDVSSKADFWRHFVLPALQCPSNGVCGEESVFSNDTGKISLEDGIIPKNQMCFWELGPFNKAIYHIQLSLINQGFTQKTLDIPGYLWIVCCIATTTPNQPSCKIELLWIRNETVIKGCIGNQVHLLFWNRQTRNDYDKDTFRIEYQMNAIEQDVIDFLSDILMVLMEWVFFKIFFVVLLMLSIANFYVKIRARRRRTRFLFELQEIGGEHETEAINVEELLDDDRIVTRMIYDENIMNEFQQSECSICLESFIQGENLARFICKHIFHVKCFEDWVKVAQPQQNIKCPICNRILS